MIADRFLLSQFDYVCVDPEYLNAQLVEQLSSFFAHGYLPGVLLF